MISFRQDKLRDHLGDLLKYGDAYVAGGAIIAHLVPKYRTDDIDVFFPCAPPIDLPPDWASVSHDQSTSEIDGARSVNFHWKPYSSIVFDLVFMPAQNSIGAILDHFDIDLARCAYDIREDLYVITAGALNNIYARHITRQYNNPNTQARVDKYLSRLPGWTSDTAAWDDAQAPFGLAF